MSDATLTVAQRLTTYLRACGIPIGSTGIMVSALEAIGVGYLLRHHTHILGCPHDGDPRLAPCAYCDAKQGYPPSWVPPNWAAMGRSTPVQKEEPPPEKTSPVCTGCGHPRKWHVHDITGQEHCLHLSFSFEGATLIGSCRCLRFKGTPPTL